MDEIQAEVEEQNQLRVAERSAKTVVVDNDLEELTEVEELTGLEELTETEGKGDIEYIVVDFVSEDRVGAV